jgi:serine protease Do
MLRPWLLLSALVACGVSCALADTIQLKDKAAVTGKVLAEKSDHIVVDIGYTVLVIPRNQVVTIVKDGTPPLASKRPRGSKAIAATATAAESAEARHGFYTASSKSPPVRTVLELVNQIGEAVVQVRTPSALGSGFFFNEDGFLITNFHVIEGETQISVEVYHQKEGQLDRKTYKQVRIVALNKFADLALLKVEDKDAPRFKYVPLGSADALSVGERVFAIGSPLGLERTVTEGILSTKTREVGGSLYLQTTAQINPGNSGGPLFNLSGEVVGVINMKVSAGEGLGFAIPVESVKLFLDHRDAFAYSNENPANPYRYLEPPSRMRQDRIEQ